MPPRILLPILLLALALLLPAAASASSIAFVKDNNIWLSSPDGSRQRQVTTDGTAAKYYNSPSQADDGTILAKHGSHFVRLRPDGTRIGEPVPGLGSDHSHSGNVFVMSGPNDPRISPDGKRFTYWVSVRGMVTCPIWDPGCSYRDTDYTIVSRVDRFTQPQEFGVVRDYRDPSWVDNDYLLVFNYGLGVKAGAISPVGKGEAGLLQWFDAPSGVHQIGQGQVTRQGDKLVTLAGSADFGPAQEHLWLYGVTSYPAPPCQPAMSPRLPRPPASSSCRAGRPTATRWRSRRATGSTSTGTSPTCGSRTRLRRDHRARARQRRLPAWGPADVPGGGRAGAAPGGGPAKPRRGLGDVKARRRQRGRAVRLRVSVLTAGADVRVKLVGARRKPVRSTASRGAAARRP